MNGLAGMLGAWPLPASIAVAIGAWGLHSGRRREALNEALHEVRRPLQAIALAAGEPGVPGGVAGSVQLAATALERLEREINGVSLGAPPEPVLVRPLLEAAVERWRPRAARGDASLELCWAGGSALVEGDPVGLAQALDNVILNALEHGGPEIRVQARLHGERLRILVTDSGRVPARQAKRRDATPLLARVSGRRRHGHGLAVVRRVVAAHGGRFALCRSERRAMAMLELPLAVSGEALAA